MNVPRETPAQRAVRQDYERKRLRRLVRWLLAYDRDVHSTADNCPECGPANHSVDDCPWAWIKFEARQHGIRAQR